MRLALVVPAGLLLVGTVLLSGCGNSKDDSQTSNNPPNDDAFITVVRQQTDSPSAMSEDTEPTDISGVVATAPEDKEPQAVAIAQ